MDRCNKQAPTIAFMESISGKITEFLEEISRLQALKLELNNLSNDLEPVWGNLFMCTDLSQ